MTTAELDTREVRLIRYALGYLEVSLDPDLTVEAAQETAPETAQTGEPLPDVRAMIGALRNKLSQRNHWPSPPITLAAPSGTTARAGVRGP